MHGGASGLVATVTDERRLEGTSAELPTVGVSVDAGWLHTHTQKVLRQRLQKHCIKWWEALSDPSAMVI